MIIQGQEPKLNVAVPGPCFRVSENKPILFLKQLEGWNPFIRDDYLFRNGNSQNGYDTHKQNNYSVSISYYVFICFYVILLQLQIYFHHNIEKIKLFNLWSRYFMELLPTPILFSFFG